MSGYFTDLLNNDAIVPVISDDDDTGFINTEYQQTNDPSLYLPTKQPVTSIPNEQDMYFTNSLPTVSTGSSTSSSFPMDFSSTDIFDHQEQQEEQEQQEQLLVDDQPDSEQVASNTRDSIMTSIEFTLLEILNSLSMLKPVELPFMVRALQRRSNITTSSSSSAPSSSGPSDQDNLQDISESRLKVLSLNHAMAATTLTRYVRVLEAIYEALANNIMMTKRDIFYRDLPLFRSQPTVDKIVDDICCHYNVPRSSLNVSASGKGRIYGPANIILKNHRVLNCMAIANDGDEDCNDEHGLLIPPINQILDVDCRSQFVVVIEKEASFRHLVSVGFVQMLLQQCVLITGCGYPDFATRHLVKHISTRYPLMPILAVMDNDPYGLDIYSVYKWGSLAQAHDSVNLTIPSMKFLGLECDDRTRYQIPEVAYAPLTSKDREKGIRMIMAAQQLQRSQMTNLEHKSFILELCKVLHMNQKCELQALVTDGPLGFIEYLRLKIERYMGSIYSY